MVSAARPPDRRIRRTRAALSDALLQLIEERPFDQITIREITTRAGVGYASFFRHYPGKEALLGGLAGGEIRNLIGLTLPALTAADTRAGAVALCTYVADRAAIWSALLTGGAASMVREEFVRQAVEIDTSPFSRPSWLPRELAIIHAASTTIEILSWWLPRRDEYSVEQAAEILERLILNPVAIG